MSYGKVIRVPVIVHVPPDTTACIVWLKNRQPDRWRDRRRLSINICSTSSAFCQARKSGSRDTVLTPNRW
jgi:hypothetical protein